MGSGVDRAVLEALARRAVEPSFPKQPSSRFQLWIELGDRLRREDVETLHELVAVPAVAESVVGLALEWEQSAAALIAAARAFANPDEGLLSRARGAVAEALAGEDRAVRRRRPAPGRAHRTGPERSSEGVALPHIYRA